MDYSIVAYEKKHAAALATMWNESTKAWPFGFGGGIPFTEQRMLEWMSETNAISIELAVRDDGTVLGFCEMVQYPKEVDAAYIALLNVHPDYHGAKVGKALLKVAVQRSVEMRFRRLDLHTWPANMKAVPLYKKCGFFWVPETTVYMKNFLPLIMQQGPAAAYFSRHDWYDTLVRSLDVAEDDEKWEGLQVCQYAWQSGNEYLNVIVDREAGCITSLETDQWAASCRLSDSAPAAGMNYPVYWSLANRTGCNRPFYVRATGDQAIQINTEFQGVLEQTFTHQAEVTVPANILPAAENQPANRVQSLVVIGEQAFMLEAGARIKQAASVDLYPPALPPFSGRPVQAHIRIKNNLDREMHGHVHLTPEAGLDVTCQETAFAAGPKEQASIPVTLRVTEPGAYRLHAMVTYADGEVLRETRLQPLPVMMVPLGGVAVAVTDDWGIIENHALRVEIARRGGHTFILDRATGRRLGYQGVEALGPPFWPSEFEAIELEMTAPPDRLVVTGRSRQHPGIVVEKTVRANAGPVIALDYRVYNFGTKPAQFQLMVNPEGMDSRQRVAYPLTTGLVVEQHVAVEFPGDDDLPRRVEDWAESWSAVEDRQSVFGIIWQGPTGETPVYNDLTIVPLQLPEIQPGSSVDVPTCYLYAGPGDYQAVRSTWQMLVHGQVGLNVLPQYSDLQRSLKFGPPSPMLVNAGESSTPIAVSALGSKPTDGTLDIRMPAGWTLEPASFELGGISRDNQFNATAAVCCPGGSEAGYADVTLTTPAGERKRRIAVIAAGNGTRPQLNDVAGGKWEANNGLLTLKVDPNFYGSCYAMEAEGVNHLYTAHPEPGIFKSAKPWYGGIHPAIYGERSLAQLYREPFQSQTVERAGANGFVWHGIETSVVSRRKDFEGIRVAIQYLSPGGSNITAVAVRLSNNAKAPVRLLAGAVAYLQPGGEYANGRLHFERNGQPAVRTREAGFSTFRAPWAAVENPSNGWTMLGMAPQGFISVMDRVDGGAHYMFGDQYELGPDQTVERIFYLVLVKSFELTRPYLELLNIQGLF